jgi:hypothetical protein
MSIASHLIANGACYCAESCDDQINDDERYIQTHISFQTICDGFIELQPTMIDSKEETDETECEQWPCNNIYTHCDGIWNCNNGEDELGCNQSSLLNCKLNEHVCISSSTYQFICLPLNKASDNIVDCFGGTDEPHLCQRPKFDRFPSRKGMFFCIRASSNCTDTLGLCGSPICDDGDDINFCTINNVTNTYINCNVQNALLRSDIEKYICDSFHFSKKKILYFSLSKPSQLTTIQTKTNSLELPSKFA